MKKVPTVYQRTLSDYVRKQRWVISRKTHIEKIKEIVSAIKKNDPETYWHANQIASASDPENWRPNFFKACIDKLGLSLVRPAASMRRKRVVLIETSSYKTQNGAAVDSKEFLQSYEWRKLRMEALKKWGARCQCCGASPHSGASINVDHIKPRKIFPHLALDIENLQVLCDACNHGKGNWDMTDWRPKGGGYDPADEFAERFGIIR